MASLQLSDDFKKSYTNCDYFPSNLIRDTTYLWAQKACRERLDDASAKLFTPMDDVEVPFRDLLPAGTGKPMPTDFYSPQSLRISGFQKRYIFNDYELKEWLGDISKIDPSTGAITGDIATKAVPKCRFV